MSRADPRTATAADRGRVVDSVVRAFVADPAFRQFFPTDDTYDAHAAAFAGWLFNRRVGGGTVWVAEDGAAVSMWEPPDRHGADVSFELPVPADVVERLERYEHAVAGLLPPQPYWYLGVLATAPDRAGRGLARAVMGAGLARATADALVSVLETTNPDNLAVYEHLGWGVRASTEVAGMTVWVLTHPPGGA